MFKSLCFYSLGLIHTAIWYLRDNCLFQVPGAWKSSSGKPELDTSFPGKATIEAKMEGNWIITFNWNTDSDPVTRTWSLYGKQWFWYSLLCFSLESASISLGSLVFYQSNWTSIFRAEAHKALVLTSSLRWF